MRHDVRLIAIPVLIAVLAGLWLMRDRPPEVGSQSVVNAEPEHAGRTNGVQPGDVQAESAAIDTRRFQTLREAVSTLHQYLAALPAGNREQLAAFWASKQIPADSGEADLHDLQGLRALRMRNDTPQSLDQATATKGVPEALQIPVTLRAQLKSGDGHDYAGWYRMRRSAVDDRWKITSASIQQVRKQADR